MKTRTWLAAVLAIVLSSVSQAAYALEVAFERDSSLPIVFLNVVFKTGSVADPHDASGLTNFMAEMLLRGTRQRDKEQIDIALDQMGASLSVEVRSEATILRGAVLSSQLNPFLDLLSEIVTEPSFPEREISKLRSETQSRILDELGNDQSLVGREFTKFLFRGNPYGNAILGTLSGLEKINQDRVEAQYHRLAIDPLLLVVGSGDTLEEKISAWADSVASKLPQTGVTGRSELIARPEDLPFRRLLLVDKPGRTQTQITGGQIGVRMTDPDFFPLYLGNDAFGGGSFSSELMDQIRVKRGWSYGAYSYFRHGRQPRSWQFYFFPKSSDSAPALAMSIELIEKLKRDGISQEQFAFSQTSLVNGAGFMFNTARKRVENKLLERTLDLPEGFMKSYGPEISKVTREQVNAALRRFLKPESLAITVVCTSKEVKDALIKASGVDPDHVEVVEYNAKD